MVSPVDICVVTVTYGDRWCFLKQSLSALIEQGVRKFVVVDNGSVEASFRAMKEFKSENCDLEILLVELGENTGSAFGFKAGLLAAKGLKSSHVWILDDDNRLEPNALINLLSAYAYLGLKSEVLLCAYRVDRARYVNAVRNGEIPRIGRNTFLDFGFQNVMKRIFSVPKGQGSSPCPYPIIETDLAPYGGLFLSKSWLERGILPDESMFLYGDDHEYAIRLRSCGARIYLCSESVVVDVDRSWNDKKNSVPAWVSKESSEKSIYFSIRNRVFLEHRYCDSKVIYFSHVCFYFLYLVFRCFLKYRSFKFLRSRVGTLALAVHSGWKSGVLGRVLTCQRFQS